MVRIGINGFGIMGRRIPRAIKNAVLEGRLEKDDIEIVAINDLDPVKKLAQLLAHDTVYRKFPGKVEHKKDKLIIDEKEIPFSTEKDPAKINWSKYGVDIVYESSGAFVKQREEGSSGAEGHFESGAKKVIFSAPSDLAHTTIVMGVNDFKYKPDEHFLISNASCTTNCLAPLALALFDIGTYKGLMTTIHAYTADQRLIDSPHDDIARAFSAAENLVPTKTGAAKAIGKVIEALDGKLDGGAVRVPIPVGSLVDLTFFLETKEVNEDKINRTIKEASKNQLNGTLDYREGPLVSSMIIGDPYPSIFDASQTRTIQTDSGTLGKVFAWYDNVSGYTDQALKLIQKVGKDL